MTIASFIPEIWAQEIIAVLQKSLVGMAIVNTDIAGAITKVGDTLKINTASAVSTFDVDSSSNITYQDVDLTDTDLIVNIYKGFALKLEDKDKIQTAAPWQSVFTEDGIYQLRDDIDVLILAEYANAGLDSYETGSTPWQLGTEAADVPKLLDSLELQLNEAKAPDSGRYILAPNILMQAFSRYGMSVDTQLGDDTRRNGFMGRLGGFDIFRTSNPTVGGGVSHGLAGVKAHSIAFAQQIAPNSLEMFRSHGRWADLIRGAVLAGIKTYRPATLIDINLNTTLLA